MLVTLLTLTDAPIQTPYIFNLPVSFNILKFGLQIGLLFVPELSASFTSYIVQTIYIPLAWILYPLQFCLFPFTKKMEAFFIKPVVYAASIHVDLDSL